ncbi:MAG: glutathione S-transferase N-terminal domain-containing protein [Marinobacter sp.]|nr:glutathione S-transferase N-terminal domain-containing protein [Marinobacter sp.]
MSVHELPFKEVRIPLNQDDTYIALAQHTDAGKVPVLKDSDLVIWDSLAICEYISEQYLGGGGWPRSVRARAEARSCSAEMHSSFPEIRGEFPMNCRAIGRKVSLHKDPRTGGGSDRPNLVTVPENLFEYRSVVVR